MTNQIAVKSLSCKNVERRRKSESDNTEQTKRERTEQERYSSSRRGKQSKSDTVDAREQEQSTVGSIESDVKEREDSNCVHHYTQKHRVKQKQISVGSEEYSTVEEEGYTTEILTTIDVQSMYCSCE